MKCNDFLPNSTTGGLAARWLARLHAIRCPRCAATWEGLAKMRAEMSPAQPLSARERKLWENAAHAPRPSEMTKPARERPLIRLATAAVLLLAAGWFFVSRDGAPPVTDRLPVPAIAVGSAAIRYTPAELADIESGLTRLSAELDRLHGLAESLDARRDLRQLSQAYPSLTVPGQTGGAPQLRRSHQ